MERHIDRVLVTEAELKAKVKELGEQISRDYEGKDLLLVGILKGAVIFLSDLARAIAIPCSFDFMAVSSYGKSTQSSGVVRILKDLDTPIEGRHVLIVEDIIDTGLTLSYLKDYLKGRGAASVKVATILDKPARRKVELTADYCGITIPDEFVVGYGLDCGEEFRHLPYVGVVKKEYYAKD